MCSWKRADTVKLTEARVLGLPSATHTLDLTHLSPQLTTLKYERGKHVLNVH